MMRIPPVTFCDGRLFYVLHNMLVYITGAVGTALETIPYVYGDSNWKDKLTSYNGQTITYDVIGNPLNDGTWTYTWQAGRQLKQMNAEGTSVSFKYDHNGMRVQKVVQQFWHPETTNYIYHGKTLTHMTVDYTDFDEVAHQDEMHFFYDAQSRPVKVEFNGTVYTYLPNLQGDIVGILDNAGTLVVEYKYDAWGTLLSTNGALAGTLGMRNPFRYRGYVYDEETELYYLRSRYYRPEWRRFVNADSVLGCTGTLGSHNQFSYCRNESIMHTDHNGQKSETIESQYPTIYYTKEYYGKSYQFKRYYVTPKIEYGWLARVIDIGIAVAALYYSVLSVSAVKRIVVKNTKKVLGKMMIKDAKKAVVTDAVAAGMEVFDFSVGDLAVAGLDFILGENAEDGVYTLPGYWVEVPLEPIPGPPPTITPAPTIAVSPEVTPSPMNPSPTRAPVY